MQFKSIAKATLLFNDKSIPPLIRVKISAGKSNLVNEVRNLFAVRPHSCKHGLMHSRQGPVRTHA